jgi:hypothetical protein
MLESLKAVFFIIGFIWVIGAPCSIIIGPFVGVDREKIKQESRDFWGDSINSKKDLLKRLIISFVFVFLFFPMVYPIRCFPIGVFFMLVAT